MHTHPLIQGKRVVRPRKRGAPLPEGGVYVGRPTIWGNPFQDRVGGHARSVILHAKWLDGRVGALMLENMRFSPAEIEAMERLRIRVLTNLHRLAGKDLACWCPLSSDWCHANTLLRMAPGYAEIEAFAAIVDQVRRQQPGSDPLATCAKRFGVTRRHVEQRLRLAALAPDVLEALRKDAITLEAAKAYAGTADAELQLKVFLDQCKPGVYRPHDPAAIRSALRGVTLGLEDPRVVWLGLDAYRAAGGRVEADLFMGEAAEERLVDAPLLERLFAEAATPHLPRLAAEGGWQSAVLSQQWCSAPRAPEGFERAWEYDAQLAELPEEERARSIAMVGCDIEDNQLRVFGRFRPVRPKEAEADRPVYTPPTAEERAAQRREHAIDTWAARLGVGAFAGTPLEGRVYWPRHDNLEREWASDDPDDYSFTAVFVTARIRVPAEAMAAAREAAEARVAEIEAEEEARRAAEEAVEDDGADDDSDGEDD